MVAKKGGSREKPSEPPFLFFEKIKNFEHYKLPPVGEKG